MVEGIPLELFAGIQWEKYLRQMETDGTYGDEITLRAISNIFNVRIIVVSTLGQRGRVEILPENAIPFGRIILGHFAEGHGDHYAVLDDLNPMSETENEDHIDYSNIENTSVRNVGYGIEINNQELQSKNSHPESTSTSLLEQLPLEILEKIFLSALISSDYTFPNHVCWTFNNMITAVPVFKLFEKRCMGHLPRIYIDNLIALPKPLCSGEILVNMQKLITAYGSMSSVILELKRIITSTK